MTNNTPLSYVKRVPKIRHDVYDTYWKFATLRQDIFFSRVDNNPQPWTDDEILSTYKFTNAYRASDRVSQYLIKNVIYKGSQDIEEIFFRTILFKIFNKIETWELLIKNLGEITLSSFSIKRYAAIFAKEMAKKKTIYSAAYIMPSGSKLFNTNRKHEAHLYLLEMMLKDNLAKQMADTLSLKEAFELLKSYPMIGDFLAYQYVIDLNYTPIIDFSEMDFVMPGPGALNGIKKCFSSLSGLTEADIIKYVTERQENEFTRLGLNFKSLWGRPLQLIDCQNLFCEVDKYSRVKYPDIIGKTKRTRIKQKFNQTGTIVSPWFPPKWGINDRIEQG